MYKTIGKKTQLFRELEEVLLDFEQTLNHWPGAYIDDGIEFPTLTRNTFIYGIYNHISPMEKKHIITDKDLRKKYHNLKHHKKFNLVKDGDVVLIKGANKNSSKWNIGIIFILDQMDTSQLWNFQLVRRLMKERFNTYIQWNYYAM